MSGVIKMRVERLADDVAKKRERLDDLLAAAEKEERALDELEERQATTLRTEIADMESEIEVLAVDLEREQGSRDVSVLLRDDTRMEIKDREGPMVYRNFAEYAVDVLVAKYPQYTNPERDQIEAANDRLERTLQNVTSSGVTGLVIPSHMTQILDIIDRSRPVVESARRVPLDRGSMTYPNIGTRAQVLQQTSEKTEAGTQAIGVANNTLNALTFLGATNISWQAVNWSTPDVIQLWVDLAAESYARQTEAVACEALETSAIGTVGTASGRLGTAGTENFAAWRTAIAAGMQNINTNTGTRFRTNTLYLSWNRFFQLATLGTDQVVQVSPIGNVDMGAGTGNFFGLNVVASHGFDQDTAIVGDSQALLVGENPGSPVELRVVEPRIGGYELGLIGAFNAVVFDVNRFQHLGTHL